MNAASDAEGSSSSSSSSSSSKSSNSRKSSKSNDENDDESQHSESSSEGVNQSEASTSGSYNEDKDSDDVSSTSSSDSACWEDLAKGPWGQEPLYRNMHLESIVGWAHHVTADTLPRWMPSHPLDSLDSLPLRPAMLEYIQDKASEMVSEDPEPGGLWGSFDQSALVAVGMVMEDVLTASLLPLAEQHVQRCRTINDRNEAFTQWTLPPLEAIAKLATKEDPDPGTAGAPTARIPNRTVVTDGHEGSRDYTTGAAAELWCKVHGTTMAEARTVPRVARLFIDADVLNVDDIDEPSDNHDELSGDSDGQDLLLSRKPSSKPPLKKRRKGNPKPDETADGKLSRNDEQVTQEDMVPIRKAPNHENSSLEDSSIVEV